MLETLNKVYKVNMKHYIFMDEAEHFIWKNQEFSDIIIDTIKKSLK